MLTSSYLTTHILAHTLCLMRKHTTSPLLSADDDPPWWLTAGPKLEGGGNTRDAGRRGTRWTVRTGECGLYLSHYTPLHSV